MKSTSYLPTYPRCCQLQFCPCSLRQDKIISGRPRSCVISPSTQKIQTLPYLPQSDLSSPPNASCSTSRRSLQSFQLFIHPASLPAPSAGRTSHALHCTAHLTLSLSLSQSTYMYINIRTVFSCVAWCAYLRTLAYLSQPLQ